MYQTIFLRGPEHAIQFLAALNYRPPEFAKSHVKALCIRLHIPLTLTVQLLTLCSGLESLALWTLPQHNTAQLGNLVSSLPLTFLSLNIMSIFSTLPKSGLQNHPAIVNLTHLDIVNRWVGWRSSLGIEHLPLLTHVAFRFSSRGSINVALSAILRQSPKLQVLVLLADSVAIPGAREYLEKQDIQDIRVVVLRHARDIDNWQSMERGSVTMWQRADRIVRWRQRNRGWCNGLWMCWRSMIRYSRTV